MVIKRIRARNSQIVLAKENPKFIQGGPSQRQASGPTNRLKLYVKTIITLIIEVGEYVISWMKMIFTFLHFKQIGVKSLYWRYSMDTSH